MLAASFFPMHHLFLVATGLFVLGPVIVAATPAPAVLFTFDAAGWHDWRDPGDWRVVGGVTLDPKDPRQLAVETGSGVWVNAPSGKSVNLISRREFGDIRLTLEFCLPQGSNSGIYFMGRYELQIFDSYGVDVDRYPGIECGGIYPQWTRGNEQRGGHSPRLNASLAPGAWQRFEVVFRAPRFNAKGEKVTPARFVRVLHNGKLIHEDVDVSAPTVSAAFADERPMGPLLLQGDHGRIAFRKLEIEPLALP